MKSARRRWLVAGATAGCGLALGGWYWRKSGASSPEAALLNSSFPDLDGQKQALNQWQDQVLLVNFWATWCEPCKEEMPLLAQSQEKFSKRLQIVGIALDNVSNIRQFTSKIPINYPLLIGDIGAVQLMRSWGNQAGALPFSVAFAADGKLLLRHLGTVTAIQIENLLS